MFIITRFLYTIIDVKLLYIHKKQYVPFLINFVVTNRDNTIGDEHKHH